MTPRTPPKVPRPARAPLATSPTIADLEAACVRDPVGAVAAFWAAHPTTPLLEPDAEGRWLVTFVLERPDARQVLLFVNRLTDERNLADSQMRRIAGTGLWHLTYRMGPTWRASYAFLVHEWSGRAPWVDEVDQVALRAALDRGLADPRNPLSVHNRAGVRQSVAELPDAPASRWLAERPGVPRGTIARHRTPDGRRVWTYLPPLDVPASPRAIVVVLDGEVWLQTQALPTTLDNLIADGEIRPALVVFVDSGGRERRWSELDGQGGLDAWIVDVLLAWVRSQFAVSHEPADVVVCGQSLGGLGALRLLVTRPDAVGAALAQSASLWLDDLGVALDAAGPRVSSTRAYVEVGTQEWVLLEPNRALAHRLADAGVDVDLEEFDGGHDYACWRVGIASGLRVLLGS